MTNVHPTAIIEGQVSLGEHVEIGPYSIISGEINIGARTKISSHVRIVGKVKIGHDCKIYHGCCIGEDAQNWGILHRKGSNSGVIIGSENIIREYVTIHSSAKVSHNTTVNHNNQIMVAVHIAHDCKIGSNITIANLSILAGGVTVEDYAYISANVNIDSEVRIGKGAFIDGTSLVLRDVPPFFQFSRRGFLYKIRKDKMRDFSFDEVSIKRYEDIRKRLWKGESWINIYNSLSRQDNSSDSILREFLRTSSKGLSCFHKPFLGRADHV